MAKLEALPDELLVRLTDFLERSDLAKVRLLNKRLSQISTAELFRTVTLYPQWRKDDERDERHSVDSEQDEGWTWAGGDEHLQVEGMAWDDAENADRENLEYVESVVPIAGVSEVDSQEAHSSGEAGKPDRPEVDAVNSGVNSCDLDEEDDFETASGQSSPTALSQRARLISLPLSHYGSRMPRWAVDRLPGPIGFDAQSFKSIMKHETLRNHVKEVEIYTCEPHCVRSLLYEFGVIAD